MKPMHAKEVCKETVKRSGLSWANALTLAADHEREVLSLAAQAFANVAAGQRLIKR